MLVTRTERGWPGHFCAARHCEYRRNTLIEMGLEKVVVSTVGMFRDPVSNELETLGTDRYFETMAYTAITNGHIWHSDFSKEVRFKSPWQLSALDMAAADRLHETVVTEIMSRLQSQFVLE